MLRHINTDRGLFMSTKLGNLIDNFKSVKAEGILKTLKTSQENMKVKNVLQLMSFVEQKTNTEIEKAVSFMVDKILEDQPINDVSEDIKNEIVQKLAGHNKGKNIIPIITYVNKIIITNVPKNFSAFRSFKKNIANTLVKDAKSRLEL